MTADQIIAAVQEVYAGCQTYADRGCVRSTSRSPEEGLNVVETIPFETVFVRPDRFRFEFSIQVSPRAKFSRCVIVANGPRVQLEGDIGPEDRRPMSLSTALACATGVSHGAAHRIPALLMPERVTGRRLAEQASLTRLEDAELDGVTCHRVECRYMIDPDDARRVREETIRVLGSAPPEGEWDPEVLWFQQESFLIRKIEDGTRFSAFRTESVTTYEPALDQPVPGHQSMSDSPNADA